MPTCWVPPASLPPFFSFSIVLIFYSLNIWSISIDSPLPHLFFSSFSPNHSQPSFPFLTSFPFPHLPRPAPPHPHQETSEHTDKTPKALWTDLLRPRCRTLPKRRSTRRARRMRAKPVDCPLIDMSESATTSASSSDLPRQHPIDRTREERGGLRCPNNVHAAISSRPGKSRGERVWGSEGGQKRVLLRPLPASLPPSDSVYGPGLPSRRAPSPNL